MPTPLPLPVPIADAARAPSLWRIPAVVGPGDSVRDVLVATPAGYDPEQGPPLPVVYLQDGQNLFDPATSFAGHWSLLETMAARADESPVIIVGIPNLGPGRLKEYSPFDDEVRGIGEGVGYLAWVTRVVKPLVDASFRTRPERIHTAVGGSSMGGLFSLYAILGAAATFGAAWAMSPALWYADGAIFRWIRRQPAPTGRIWLDVGTEEGDDEVYDVRRMRDILLDRGWIMGGTLGYAEDPGAGHDETAWGQRVAAHWPALVGMIS